MTCQPLTALQLITRSYAHPPTPLSSQFVLLMSPPCTAYSCANTTTKAAKLEELMKATDSLIDGVRHKIWNELCDSNRGICIVLENPATGRLPSRDVVGPDWLPSRHTLDYCAYGWVLKKSTMLFSSLDLEDHGMLVMTCKGECCLSTACDAQGRRRHIVHWESTNVLLRQSIPIMMSMQLGVALAEVVKKAARR